MSSAAAAPVAREYAPASSSAAPRLLTPAAAQGRARAHRRAGFGFGRRFLFMLLLGLLWLVPAFWEPTFVYGMLVWDVLLLGAWALDLVRLPEPGELEVERQWTSPLALGIGSQVRLILRSRARAGVRCRVVDDVPLQLRREPAELRLRAAPGSEGESSYQVRPLERGDLHVGNVYLRYQSALEMAERWAVCEMRQSVRCYPDLEAAKRQTIYLARTRQIELEKRLLRQRGMGREFESLREYREGDEFRDICWTASARRGKLVTKVHQVERSQPVWVVLDCGRLLRARIGELSKLDHAVNAALGLAQLAVFSGDRVGLLAYGRTLKSRINVGRGPAQLRQILDALAVLQPDASEADHLRAAGALLMTQKRRSLVVWITDLAETAMTPEVIEAASQALSRHLLLFVVIGQPDLVQAAAQRPANPQEMYRAAAAQEMVQRRELLLTRLRERGALALETSAQGLSTALVNHYLLVKERSLL